MKAHQLPIPDHLSIQLDLQALHLIVTIRLKLKHQSLNLDQKQNLNLYLDAGTLHVCIVLQFKCQYLSLDITVIEIWVYYLFIIKLGLSGPC